MFFKFFGKTYGKIKNENDMLGFLIAHMDSRKGIHADVILEESGLDNPTCYNLLRLYTSVHTMRFRAVSSLTLLSFQFLIVYLICNFFIPQCR